MKVRVDEDLCIGDEACVEVCPEIFEMQGDVARAKMEEVPGELKECCGNAAASCPMDAIVIEEE